MITPDQKLAISLDKAKQPRDHTTPLAAYYTACDEIALKIETARKVVLACRGGCSFCCYQRVTVVAHEVFLISWYVSEKLSDLDRESLMTALRTHVEVIRKLSNTDRDRMNIACPFLVGGRCRIYPVRPIVCHGSHSLDVLKCERNYDQRSEGIVPVLVSSALSDAWEEMGGRGDLCYEHAGYDMTEYDLPVAVLAALTNSIHEKRWRQKKRAMLEVLSEHTSAEESA